MKKDDAWYERELVSFIQQIAWEQNSIADMEKRKAGFMAVLIYNIHPVLRDSKKYVYETGEVLIDHERYNTAMEKAKSLDYDCHILDVCINDSIFELGRIEEELEAFKVERIRSKVKTNSDHIRAEQFFSRPKSKGKGVQLNLEL